MGSSSNVVLNAFTPSRYHVMERRGFIKYDKVVDRTEFKIGDDSERNKRLSDSAGSISQGVYDFQSEKEIGTKNITDTEIALRSGQLDKADVDTLLRAQEQQAKAENQDNLSKADKKKKEQLEDARQSYLDKRTGFDSEQEQSSSSSK